MSRFGESMKSSELQDMMKEADCAGEGKVDYRSKSFVSCVVSIFITCALVMSDMI